MKRISSSCILAFPRWEIYRLGGLLAASLLLEAAAVTLLSARFFHPAADRNGRDLSLLTIQRLLQRFLLSRRLKVLAWTPSFLSIFTYILLK